MRLLKNILAGLLLSTTCLFSTQAHSRYDSLADKAESAHPSAATDKHRFSLTGVWYLAKVVAGMESQELDREKYVRLKIYTADSIYHCIELMRIGEQVLVIPHESGPYSIAQHGSNYVECGRETPLTAVSDNQVITQWQSQYEYWQRLNGIPASILDKLLKRVNEDPAFNKALLDSNIFNKQTKKGE